MARLRWAIIFLVHWLGFAIATGPPRVIGKINPRHIAKVGKNTKLACPVDADLPPRWKKDGQTINNGWTRFKISSEGHLRIKNISMDDAGHYMCKAVNGFGSININYTVIVVNEETGMVKEDDMTTYQKSPEEDLRKEGARPHFTDLQKMKRQHILRPVGSSVRLKCRALGNPRPHVTWYKNDDLIKQDKDSIKRPKWILKLHNLVESNSGKYTCVVANRLGAVNYTYTLEVIEKIKTKPMLIPPHPKNTTVEQGDTASFQCRVKSVVEPHIQWLKRVEMDTVPNKNTTIVVKGQKFVVLKTGKVWNRSDGSYLNKLVITRAAEQDAGMYICLGANNMGYSFRSAYLTVLPSSNSGMPHHVQGSSSNSNNNLPLFIGVPACGVLILVVIAIFFLQRRKRCNSAGSNLKIPRLPVPTHDRDYYTNYHSASMLQNSREKIPKTHSLDFCSDISSVSRTNHHHQHMQNYGY